MSVAKLDWADPTMRTNGKPLDPADIARIDIYDSLVNPSNPSASVAGGVGTYTTGELDSGTHVFTLVVLDTDGDSSAASNPATAKITPAPPAAITTLQVTVI